mmetsp:Transcript_21529/g.30158  ORF Transcript_21529/g.30158 Transcript_21529/m.30158 type:complete len:341 (-) Transcript_21529:25-1047(-)
MGSHSDDRLVMVGCLASLLGFDDVSDVFDQLLSVETREDLLEYMTSLLGEDNEEIQTFVDNVIRFKNDQVLLLPPNSIEKTKDKSKDNAKEITYASKTEVKMNDLAYDPASKTRKPSKSVSQKNRRQKGSLKKGKSTSDISDNKFGDGIRDSQLVTSGTVKGAKLDIEGKRGMSRERSEDNQLETATRFDNCDVSKQNKPSQTVADKPRPPQRGKATVNCGCFGTKHKPLTNCLHCGRIACEREGYGYCPFCGYLIERVSDFASGFNEAMTKAAHHKERLLKFDREFTRRTIIYDDQEDYFNSSRSTWLTEDEQLDAEKKDLLDRKEKHDHKNQVLNIII